MSGVTLKPISLNDHESPIGIAAGSAYPPKIDWAISVRSRARVNASRTRLSFVGGVTTAEQRDPGRFLGDELERHVLVLRHADAPVVVDGGHLDVRADDLLDELVRARADGLAREDVVAVGLDVLLRQHDPLGRQRP